MRSRIVSRRRFLNEAALVALMVCLSGCTKSVTKYHSDGTPYTEEVEDWVAIALLFIVLGVLAASSRDSDSSSNYEGEGQDPQGDEGKIRFVSMGTKRALPHGGSVEKVSVTDREGRLLVTVDAFEHVEHKDLEAVESLFASAQISNLKKPIVIRLKQDKLDLYRVEYIRFLKKPSGGRFTLFNRQINGKPYKVKVFTHMGNIVDIEIVPQILGSQSVA